MGRKGRPQKPGKRTKANRPVPARTFDRGTDRVQAMRGRYGDHYSTPLGRAYITGLLGKDEKGDPSAEASDRYHAAKRFARAYARIISQDRYRCALDRTPRGNLALAEDPDILAVEAEEQDWLFAAMETIDATGCRPFVDQLLSTLYTDHGPHWLDPLLAGHTDPADLALLNAAIKGIDAITPKRTAHIRVVRY